MKQVKQDFDLSNYISAICKKQVKQNETRCNDVFVGVFMGNFCLT